MANPEHLKILKRGVAAWNAWRDKTGEDEPDLSGADLSGMNLKLADLSKVDLSHANLSGAFMRGAICWSASLVGANLTGATLVAVTFGRADLSRASLATAPIGQTCFVGAQLNNVSMASARLVESDFSWASLEGTNFSGAEIAAVTFGHNDLRGARGLSEVRHHAPSTIDFATLYLSGGAIPEDFLRGCGLPESYIVQVPSLIGAFQVIQFYSCFISYSSRDQEFAERLHADLQARGVRVWFAPHDLPIGARIRPSIDESIRVHDKLLLVLSEHSVSSQWVEQEVETALAREREQEGKTVLFPIRIDDAVMASRAGWPALIKNSRNVGDFTRWKEHDSYQKAFERLLRGLKAGA